MMIKTTVVRIRQRAAQLSIELSTTPMTWHLPSKQPAVTRAAIKLEQLMVDCGRANRQFTLAEGQQEMLTRLAVVFGLGVRVLAVL